MKNNVNQCGICEAEIAEGQDIVMIQSTDCFHTVHMECFKERGKQCLIEDMVMVCPECRKIIDENEIKNYLSSEEIEQIDKMKLDKMLQQQGNIARCPLENCGNVMEVSPG